MNSTQSLVPLSTTDESYLGFLIAITLLIVSTLLIGFILKFIAEGWRFAKARYRGETYTFHLQNPFQSISNGYFGTQAWFREKTKQIGIIIQAIRNIKWFINQTYTYEVKRKYAFVAYSFMLVLFGAIMSDLWDYALQIDWIHIVTNIVKAI